MLVLASGSPRRKELLKLLTDDFSVEPADIDETVTKDIELIKFPEYLAIKKSRYIFERSHFNDTVIGCDTGVFIDGIMLGKPESENQAKEMLRLLSGRTHKVITGCSIFHKGVNVSFSETTLVEFYPLTIEEIEAYVATGDPMDKAGGYGIQGKGATLVKSITGDYYNVVGLPIGTLNRQLRKLRAIDFD